MSKGLEALEELECVLSCNPGTKRYANIFDNYLISPIEKELRALEIIKRQPFAFASLAIFLNSFCSYEEWEKTNPDCFTREEYESLREILE